MKNLRKTIFSTRLTRASTRRCGRYADEKFSRCRQPRFVRRANVLRASTPVAPNRAVYFNCSIHRALRLRCVAVRVNDAQLVMLSERAHYDHSLTGYLHKRAAESTKWQLRWFVLYQVSELFVMLPTIERTVHLRPCCEKRDEPICVCINSHRVLHCLKQRRDLDLI